MNANEFVQNAAERMAADGHEVGSAQLPSGWALVGYQSQFRLSWMATKLHLFVVMVPVEQASADLLATLTSEAIDYAKSAKGQLRGFQSGVAVLPVLVAERVLPDACVAAQARPAKHFAVVTLPALVDATTGQVHEYTGRIVFGGIYAGWLRQRLAAAVHNDKR